MALDVHSEIEDDSKKNLLLCTKLTEARGQGLLPVPAVQGTVSRIRDSLESKRMSGVICVRSIAALVKGTVYRMVVRPAMMYGLESVVQRPN